MSNTRAIILPVELLGINVDVNRFITNILIEAKRHNPRLKYKATFQRQCTTLTKNFNAGKINHETFSTTLLSLLELVDFPVSKLWTAWNKAITIRSNINEKLDDLKQFANSNNCLLYFVFETNPKHLDFINQALERKDIKINTSAFPATLESHPIYISYLRKKRGTELSKIILADIANKQLNHPSEVFFVVNDPEKITSNQQKKDAEAELVATQLLCGTNKRTILHTDNDLIGTLRNALSEPFDLTSERSFKSSKSLRSSI